LIQLVFTSINIFAVGSAKSCLRYAC